VEEWIRDLEIITQAWINTAVENPEDLVNPVEFLPLIVPGKGDRIFCRGARLSSPQPVAD